MNISRFLVGKMEKLRMKEEGAESVKFRLHQWARGYGTRRFKKEGGTNTSIPHGGKESGLGTPGRAMR